VSTIAIGVMSGTSCDGIDAVAIELASLVRPHRPRVLGHVYRPYPAALREELLAPERLILSRVAELHFQLAELYAKAVLGLRDAARARCCGLHGQTVWHAPRTGRARVGATLQIGSSAVLAQRTSLPVVGDLRSADVALGGQGAPIVPIAHWFFTAAERAPQVVVNLGGICNFTYVSHDPRRVVAYDVGPGLMLSDAFAREATAGRLAFDRDGVLSRGGQPIPELIEALARHPFVRRAPPKSTGREDFGAAFASQLFRRHRRASERDVAYSLLAATVRVLGEALAGDPRVRDRFSRVTLTGGGASNPTLVALARRQFPHATVEVARDGVLAPRHHEPAAMALIAARTLAGLPSAMPSVTGAARPAILGHIHWPSSSARSVSFARLVGGARPPRSSGRGKRVSTR
jgi:anhydro-N-acetylmuramic acid kinase